MDDITRGIVSFLGKPLPTGCSALIETRNGCLYAVPAHEGKVIKINPVSGRVREIGEPICPCSDVAQADNGHLYTLPIRSSRPPPRQVHCVDLDAETSLQIEGLSGNQTRYTCLAAAGNGCLYSVLADSTASWILEINPAKRTVDHIQVQVDVRTKEPYRGCTQAATGYLYAVPHDADHVLEIDPTSRAIRTIGEQIQPGTRDKYQSSLMADNGKLYAMPYMASHVLEVDTEARTVKQIGEAIAEKPGFGVSQVLMNGKIWSITQHSLPALQLLEFDPRQGKHLVHQVKDMLHSVKDEGAKYAYYSCLVAAGNGRLYAVPSTANSYVLEIDPECGTAFEIGEPLPGPYWKALSTSSGTVFAIPHQAGHPIIKIDYLSLPRNSSKIHAALKASLLSGIYSDVMVRTSHDKTYRAHKLILVSRSRVFQTMFASSMREMQNAVVDLGDVSPKVSDMFMQYLYAEDTNVQRVSVQELCELKALAHRYETTDLVEACASLLQAILSVRNAAHILKLADRFQCGDLKQACLDFIVANQAVMDTDEWDEVSASPALAREVADALTGRRWKKRRVADWEFPSNTDWATLPLPKLRRACAERGFATDGERWSLLERLQV